MKEIYPVYRLINNERVLLPEGQIEGRRYRTVVNVGTGESYIIEFTDEEEKEANIQLEKWISEEPQRLAEEKRQKEEYEKFKSYLAYEDRIIAFLDIMGWSEAIKNSINDPSLTIQLGLGINYIDNLKKMAEWRQDFQSPDDYQISQFSDCIILSTNCNAYSFEHLSLQLSVIIQYFLSIKLPIRGAITIGKLIHKKSLVYGPALLRAYQLERDVAIWPRVIFDDNIISCIPKRIIVDVKSGNRITEPDKWDIDNDGWAFFDYLKSPFETFESNSMSDYQKNILIQSRAFILENLSKYKKDSKTHSKYMRMALYFNRYLSRYTYITIEPINIDLCR